MSESNSFDHERVDDMSRLLEELDCGSIESVDQLDEDVLNRLVQQLGTREEVERIWDLMRGGEEPPR